MSKNSSIISIGIFSGIIFILSTFFHFQLQIINGLNNEPVPGFDVAVSYWRTLFEPIVGPLLFFQNAYLPIQEFFTLFPLGVIVLFFYYLIKVLKNKHTSLWKVFFIWALSIPLIFSIWFFLFTVMLFLPLPINTIVNNTEDYILIDTHSHTEHSHDGLISQETQLKWHKLNGFDAFFITDHNNHKKTLEFVQKQRLGEIAPHPLVMCGEEFSGSNHMTLLGLKQDFSTKGLPDSVVIDTVHAMGGVVLVAHWFDRKGKELSFYTGLGVDGYEIINPGTERTYDRKIFQTLVDHCSENGLIMNGACDYHGHGSGTIVWNALKIPGWRSFTLQKKEESILDVLRQRDQSKITVLNYYDRKIPEKVNEFPNPLITMVDYFRTLSLFQVLSWIIWLIIFHIIGKLLSTSKKFKQIKSRPLQIWSFLGLISTFFVLFIGSQFYKNAQIIIGENDIYEEYSGIFLSFGGGLFIYSLIVFFASRRYSLFVV